MGSLSSATKTRTFGNAKVISRGKSSKSISKAVGKGSASGSPTKPTGQTQEVIEIRNGERKVIKPEQPVPEGTKYQLYDPKTGNVRNLTEQGYQLYVREQERELSRQKELARQQQERERLLEKQKEAQKQKETLQQQAILQELNKKVKDTPLYTTRKKYFKKDYYKEQEKTLTSAQITQLRKEGKINELQEMGLGLYADVPPPKDSTITTKYYKESKRKDATAVFTQPFIEKKKELTLEEKKKQKIPTGEIKPAKSFREQVFDIATKEKGLGKESRKTFSLLQERIESQRKVQELTPTASKDIWKPLQYEGLAFITSATRTGVDISTNPKGFVKDTGKFYYNLATDPLGTSKEVLDYAVAEPGKFAGETYIYGKTFQAGSKASPIKIKKGYFTTEGKPTLKWGEGRTFFPEVIDVTLGYGKYKTTVTQGKASFTPKKVSIKGQGIEIFKIQPPTRNLYYRVQKSRLFKDSLSSSLKGSALGRSKKAGKGFSFTQTAPKRGKTIRIRKEKIKKGKPTSKAMQRQLTYNQYYNPKTIIPTSGEFKGYYMEKGKKLTAFREPARLKVYEELKVTDLGKGAFSIKKGDRFLSIESKGGLIVKGKGGEKVGKEIPVGSPFPLRKQYYQGVFNPERKTQDMLNIKTPERRLRDYQPKQNKKYLFNEKTKIEKIDNMGINIDKPEIRWSLQRPTGKIRKERTDVVEKQQSLLMAKKSKLYRKIVYDEPLDAEVKKREKIKYPEPVIINYKRQKPQTTSIFAGDVKITREPASTKELDYFSYRKPKGGFRKGMREQLFGKIQTREQAEAQFKEGQGVGALSFKKGKGFSPEFYYKNVDMEFPVSIYDKKNVYYEKRISKDDVIGGEKYDMVGDIKYDVINKYKLNQNIEPLIATKQSNLYSLKDVQVPKLSQIPALEQKTKQDTLYDVESVSEFETPLKVETPKIFRETPKRQKQRERKLREDYIISPPSEIFRPRERYKPPEEKIPEEPIRRVKRLPIMEDILKRKTLYTSEVKERGKWRSFNQFPSSLERATKQVRDYVDETPRASFRLRPTTETKEDYNKKARKYLPEKKWRKSKNKRTPNVFVERAKYRIDSAGEKSGITFKGLQKIKAMGRIKWK